MRRNETSVLNRNLVIETVFIFFSAWDSLCWSRTATTSCTNTDRLGGTGYASPHCASSDSFRYERRDETRLGIPEKPYSSSYSVLLNSIRKGKKSDIQTWLENCLE